MKNATKSISNAMFRRDRIRQLILETDQILARIYGSKKFVPGRDPLTELVFTILSQNTNDNNRDRAFAALIDNFPRWQDMDAASVRQIASAIKPAGLAEIRAKRIKSILKFLKKSHGDYTLDFLSDWSDDEIVRYLTSLDGVGRKTAACVMAFSLGRNVMPVDTHVYRVAGRIGLIPHGASVEKAHDFFAGYSNDVSLYRFHLNLIAHGRAICRSRNPLCYSCELRRICSYGCKVENEKYHQKNKSESFYG